VLNIVWIRIRNWNQIFSYVVITGTVTNHYPTTLVFRSIISQCGSEDPDPVFYLNVDTEIVIRFFPMRVQTRIQALQSNQTFNFYISSFSFSWFSLSVQKGGEEFLQ